VPKSTVSIPGYVKSDDESVTFNLYEQPMKLPYKTPGPALAELVGSGGSSSSSGGGNNNSGSDSKGSSGNEPTVDTSKETPETTAPVSKCAAAFKRRAQMTQTEGLEPDNCILSYAGFCATESPDYSDEAGCWDSGEDCWKQNEACWDHARNLPIGGNPWCKLLGEKCEAMNAACKARNFNGPENKGAVLTPAAATLEIVYPKGAVAS